SVVMRTRSPASAPRRSGIGRSLELRERPRLLRLDIAEGGERFEVVGVCALPRFVVASPEAEGVLGRARVRKERDRIVRPNAGVLHLLAPDADVLLPIAGRIEQVRLDERD